MFLYNILKPSSGAARVIPSPVKATFSQPEDSSGLAVSSELDTALRECTEKVDRIANECRAKNMKFRDVEFDLENDRDICLNGLLLPDSNTVAGNIIQPLQLLQPPDVLRVTEIFENPSFFVDGADSNDIVQGELGDCWFLSALATMTTKKGLIEKFCVTRHEDVGIYGFIFFRDDHWVSVIIDDQLFTNIPKFEELHPSFKIYYGNDKELYNKSARRGNHSLCFAKSSTDGETWVPLIEKAYAKLHGDYASLVSGFSSEAIEDLTGGISTFIRTKDIFDVDKFWTEELMSATKDRLFGCSFAGSGKNGLIGNHAYSVLRAMQINGKRFLVLRNPWGNSEWTGAWSDGSKEWNAQTFELLPILEHSFGNDGQFVMEYSDFLQCWDEIERTLLLDADGSNWISSSHWLRVNTRPLPSAWTYGDVCFTISIPHRSSAIIVLSQLDTRYFKRISSPYEWTFDFQLFKRGESLPLGTLPRHRFYSRSVNLEVVLEEGEYIVHVRLDRRPNSKYIYDEDRLACDHRKLSRVRMAKAFSQSIASNFRKEQWADTLGVPIEELAGLDLEDVQKRAAEAHKMNTAQQVDEQPVEAVAAAVQIVVETDSDSAPATTEEPAVAKPIEESGKDVSPADPNKADDRAQQVQPQAAPIPIAVAAQLPPNLAQPEPEPEEDLDDENAVILGLRVYTDKEAGAAVIGGQLRYEMEAAFANMVI
ncbi:cysteine proteinase [Favolaschia claudopus]|uniref:Cysteine proteinase n=1 Tax=Favolaschia claudopus TaxID=2862362 RepID=A0AAW0AW91_9AGAR